MRDLARRGGTLDNPIAKVDIRRILGLEPGPERTRLRARVTGSHPSKGYRLEKLRYESLSGFLVTAHLYIPDGEGPFPLVINTHGHLPFKKSQPHVQSRGISLALEGIAALIIDSPGYSDDRIQVNERSGIGSQDDWALSMGIPVVGFYVWDLIRGLDYIEGRPEINLDKIGISCDSEGGLAGAFAFALDERLKCATFVCTASSFAFSKLDFGLDIHTPGISNLGDWSDILANRIPSPILLIGASEDSENTVEGLKATFNKLQPGFRTKRAEGNLKLEVVDGPKDYSRRMRESMVAFFRQHLLDEPAKSFVPEKRPLTDSFHNPFESGTAAVDDPRLTVLPWFDRQTKTFRDFSAHPVDSTIQAPFHHEKRLVGWGRYGRVEKIQPHDVLTIRDCRSASGRADDLILPFELLDQRLCIDLGLSVSEVFGQLLHFSLPEGPQGWESTGVQSMTGDAITSMIASMKTLVSSQTPSKPVIQVIADGPISSMVAVHLKLYRPLLDVACSHHFGGWDDLLNSGIRQLVHPGAIYVTWPF